MDTENLTDSAPVASTPGLDNDIAFRPATFMPITGGAMGAAWTETEGFYAGAAALAEATMLGMVTQRRACDTLRGLMQRRETALSLEPPAFIVISDEHGTREVKVGNEEQRKAARAYVLAGDGEYQGWVQALGTLGRQIAQAEARHERAILDCRLARLRMEMMVGIARGEMGGAGLHVRPAPPSSESE